MGPSTTEGVFDPFQSRILYGVLTRRVYIRECFPGWNRRSVPWEEKEDVRSGNRVSIKAPPAREARGVGLPKRCANHAAFILEASRARPLKLAPANSHANAS